MKALGIRRDKDVMQLLTKLRGNVENLNDADKFVDHNVENPQWSRQYLG